MSEEILHGFTCEFVHEGDTCKLVDVLVDENHKLREQGTRLFDKTLELGTQNAKLRELMRHIYECMCNIDLDGNHECDSCEYDNEEGRCDYVRQMRELGVEYV